MHSGARIRLCRGGLLFKYALRLTAGFVLAGLLPLLATAQQTAPPSNPDSAAQAQPQAPEKDPPAPTAQPATPVQDNKSPDANGKVSGTSNDRLFYTLPNFLSLETTSKVPPLTTKQ